jgi:hypothetical protein
MMTRRALGFPQGACLGIKTNSKNENELVHILIASRPPVD